MKEIMDGCTAAAYVAYAMSDVATIYPITPIASMGETAQKWGMSGITNYDGQTLRVEEMESELGAAGATHGALAAGSLATTFTNSQGLLLMIPNMYKIAGNQLPAVFHVGTRSLATHALSIFGDHQDIMAARATGFAFLGSSSVQETMDLAVVAHLAALAGNLPVCHFFDGWRTSNEMQTIDAIPYSDIFSLIDYDKIKAFRSRALNPEHPKLAGSCQNPDVYFQNAEAVNSLYRDFPGVVEQEMERLAKVTGREYHIFDYYGAEDAEAVIISMGSSCEVVARTVDYLNARGYKVGHVKVRLFRPFSAEYLLKVLPSTVKVIGVLDRTKEAGAGGEPLFKDVATAVALSDRAGKIRVTGGRYGLSSKDFSPAMAKAVFDDLLTINPKTEFTVGINDDVTGLSLPVGDDIDCTPPDLKQAVFYGMGSDGTVGAAKQAADILGNAPGLYAQAFFSYSAKKSGGYTLSQLRIGNKPITAAYGIKGADYICCNKDTYVNRFPLILNLKEGGVFVINCSWKPENIGTHLPATLKRLISRKKARIFLVDAQAIAAKVGLGVRINTIMETVFFRLLEIMPFEQAVAELKKRITRVYIHEGGEVVDKNIKAVDMAVDAAVEVDVPAEWASASEPVLKPYGWQLGDEQSPLADFVRKIAGPCLKLEGDSLPVSLFRADGHMPMGTTAFEKRGIALRVPRWISEKCVQCTECSFVCPHAAIRPYLLDENELESAPQGISTIQFKEGDVEGLHYRIQNFTEDCTGCGSCATICPGKALEMVPIGEEISVQAPFLDYCETKVSLKTAGLPRFTVNGSQMHRPLMQFSGACAGCGETPYVKLLTQLFGERMLVANATGCSSVWGANFPSNAYCTLDDGRGPAWGNSLFEDNAEYGYGMAVSVRQRREGLRAAADEIRTYITTIRQGRSEGNLPPVTDSALSNLGDALGGWIDAFDDPDASYSTGQALVEAFKAVPQLPPMSKLEDKADFIRSNVDMLAKKSVWAIGGDGWAYDIGFAGLDHVLASGEDINLLVMDTECYSNTGGQTSKATPLSAVTKYSPAGKRTFKKNLGQMMMTYGNVYVASIALGANFQQAVDALREAEAYPGPSLVIRYCPCINHGIRAGMGTSIVEERRAVECGYWPLFRYNPLLIDGGLEPYIEDSIDANIRIDALPAKGSPSQAEDKDAATSGLGPWDKVASETEPLTVDAGITADLDPFLDGEDRYADIRLVAPGDADNLRTDLNNRLHRELWLLQNSPLAAMQPSEENTGKDTESTSKKD